MIPETKQAAVSRALTETFGAPDFDDLTPLTAGLSTALVFRIVVQGQAYLLRLVMPGATPGGVPARQFACMTTAADAGVAPRVLYTSVDDELLLSDFVDRKPYPQDAAVRVAAALRRLHSVEGFPVTIRYVDVMDGLVGRFRQTSLVPEQTIREVLRGYDEAMRVYPRQTNLVACHNDLKSDNVLFDGERMLFVDWEAAFVNDRYSDLAWAATFFVQDRATEDDYLVAYFNEPVDEFCRGRYFLMRQLQHVFAVALILPMVAKAGLPIDADGDLPAFSEFHRRWIDRDITLAGMAERRDYALVHLRAAAEEMATERFAEAVTAVARGRHTS